MRNSSSWDCLRDFVWLWLHKPWLANSLKKKRKAGNNQRFCRSEQPVMDHLPVQGLPDSCGPPGLCDPAGPEMSSLTGKSGDKSKTFKKIVQETEGAAREASDMPSAITASNQPSTKQLRGTRQWKRSFISQSQTYRNFLLGGKRNSIPPTTTLRNFREKLREATGKCFVDVAFWGGVVPGNQHELRPMIKAGVAGFKCFLIHSGVDEFPHVSDFDLHTAMRQLQGTESVLLFHAEIDVHQTTEEIGDPCKYSTFLQSRPDIMELEAIRTVTELCLQYQVRCHIVHLSSAKPLKLIQDARRAGAPLTVETTHHYLSLCAEKIPAGATQFKCCPPIRDSNNQEKLWSALKAGQIDMVVSDHSPCTPDLKKLDSGDFTQAWGGISSLQFGLPLFWSSASKRGFQLADVVRLLSRKTAQLSSLGNQKGILVPGFDADLVIWDPEREFEIEETSIFHKNKLTPYLGVTLQGVVRATILTGRLIYRDGSFCPEPLGKHLLIGQRAESGPNIKHENKL